MNPRGPVKLFYEDADSPGTFIELGCVLDVTGPNITGTDIDISSSCSDQFLEFKRGKLNGGEVSGTLLFENAGNYNMALHLFNEPDYSPAGWDWYLEDEDGSKYNFTGYLRDLGYAAPFNDKITAPFAIKVTGELNGMDGGTS